MVNAVFDGNVVRMLDLPKYPLLLHHSFYSRLKCARRNNLWDKALKHLNFRLKGYDSFNQ